MHRPPAFIASLAALLWPAPPGPRTPRSARSSYRAAWGPWGLALAAALAVALAGCADDGTAACTSSADCREGFQCGAGPFAGKCIQIVPVVACGATFCNRLTESCVGGGCVPKAAVTGDAGPGTGGHTGQGGTGGTPPTGGSGGGVSPRPDGGSEPDDRGAPPEPDAYIPEVPPTVTLESPVDGQLIVDAPVELRGRVFGLSRVAVVTYKVDDEAEGHPLTMDGDAYQATLEVPPGRHTVSVVAEQGGQRGAMGASFRSDFLVTRDADRLVAKGAPWRFMGVQVPALRELAWRRSIGGEDQVREILNEAARLGVRVLRVPACDDRPGENTAIQTAPGVYNEPGLEALDTVIAEAGNAGLKVLLPLVDAGDGLGGINQYLRWHGYPVPIAQDKRHFFEPGPIREAFKGYVRTLLSRRNTVNQLLYVDDPAILGWEVFISADALAVFDPVSAGNENADFLTDVTQVMAAGAPRALVGTGEMGFDVNPTTYGHSADPFHEVGLDGLFDASHGFAWQRNARTGTVSYAGLQIVPDYFGFSGDPILYANLGASWIRGHAGLSASIGKPIVVTLAAENIVILSPEGRRSALSAWLDEMDALRISGFVVGNLHPDGFDPRADPHGFAWGNDTAIEDPANELAPVLQARAAELNAANP